MSCDSLPLVSILTPTYNRHDFMPILVECIERQTYPLSCIEWVIIDDSCENIQDWVRNLPLAYRLHALNYIYLDRKNTIGSKRNIAKKTSRGEFCVHMDDDDYYAPNYVAVVMNIFKRNRGIGIVGATSIYFLYPNSPFLYHVGPVHKSHTCGGVMSYRRSVANNAHFNARTQYGEEPQFLRNSKAFVYQIESSYMFYIPLAHHSNTVNKKSLCRRHTTLPWMCYVDNPLAIIKYMDLNHAMMFNLFNIGFNDNAQKNTCLKDSKTKASNFAYDAVQCICRHVLAVLLAFYHQYCMRTTSSSHLFSPYWDGMSLRQNQANYAIDHLLPQSGV